MRTSVRFLLAMAGLGGLLYGIDFGTIAAAMPYLRELKLFSDTALGRCSSAASSRRFRRADVPAETRNGGHDAGSDGFFWDEPHYAFPKGIASITGGVADDWTCYCPVCRKRFEDYYGYPMPRYMTNDVKLFRWREAFALLQKRADAKIWKAAWAKATKAAKTIAPSKGPDTNEAIKVAEVR